MKRISKNTISFWVRVVLNEVCKTSSCGNCSEMQSKTHEVWSLDAAQEEHCGPASDEGWNVGLSNLIHVILPKGCHPQTDGYLFP